MEKPLHKKILIIDDEPDYVHLLRFRLESFGFQVISTPDGNEGLKKAQEDHPDLIILDVMMPGMDGYATLKLLKEDENTKDIPIIVITCRSESEKLFNKEGVKGFIVKPYDKDSLLDMIKKGLYEK